MSPTAHSSDTGLCRALGRGLQAEDEALKARVKQRQVS